MVVVVVAIVSCCLYVLGLVWFVWLLVGWMVVVVAISDYCCGCSCQCFRCFVCCRCCQYVDGVDGVNGETLVRPSAAKPRCSCIVLVVAVNVCVSAQV